MYLFCRIGWLDIFNLYEHVIRYDDAISPFSDRFGSRYRDNCHIQAMPFYQNINIPLSSRYDDFNRTIDAIRRIDASI